MKKMFSIIRRAIWLTIAGLAILAERSGAQSTMHVFAPPESETNLNGNSSLSPFATAGYRRLQQVYSANSFSSLSPQGGNIVQLIVRIDPVIGFSAINTITNFQISLSTTSRSPDGLSSVFAENIGTDELTVVGPGSMVWQPNLGFSGGFTFLNRPFYYNPANGNLLVDFRITTGAGFPPSGGPPLDAFNVVGDSVSSVFAEGLSPSGQTSSLGLATLVVVQAVPEPDSVFLLLVGLASFGLLWKRNRQRKE